MIFCKVSIDYDIGTNSATRLGIPPKRKLQLKIISSWKRQTFYNDDLQSPLTCSQDESQMEYTTYLGTGRELLRGMYRTGDVYIADSSGTPLVKTAVSESAAQKLQINKYCIDRTVRYASYTNWTLHEVGLLKPIFNQLRRKNSTRTLITYTKQLNEIMPTQYRLHKMKAAVSPKCVCCPMEVRETPEHVLYCMSVSRVLLRDHIIHRLQHWQ